MIKRIEIITIGDEVLRGETQENNGAWLARVLIRSGLEPWRITVLPDDMDILVRELREAAGRSEWIIVTGGLGPTVDDITKEAAIRAFALSTGFRQDIVDAVAARLTERGSVMPAGYRDQGRIPDGAGVLPNPIGLAVGLRVRAGSAELFLLPGVPAEMKAMFEGSVLPALEPPGKDASVRLRTFGLTETELEDHLRKAIPEESLRAVSIISSPRGVDAYIPPGQDQLVYISAAERELRSYIFTEGDARMEAVVVGLLVSRRKTVATAESITGGLIASTLVSVPGASDTFREGFVTYGNEAKIEHLGVSAKTLDAHGAVSSQTCVEMAEGARERAGTDFALSTTGIAGPTGGVSGKPVGTCFVALAAPEVVYCRGFQFPGDREMVRLRTAYFALDMLRLALIGEHERLEKFRLVDERGRGDATGRKR